MSHIPSSAMPHAGPAHHDAPAADDRPKPPTHDKRGGKAGGWPLAAIALGGALALGAVAVAVPLLRGPAAKPKPKPKGKRKARG